MRIADIKILTAMELVNIAMDFSEEINCESIDQFLFRKFGLNYFKLDFYKEVKHFLYLNFERLETEINGCKSYSWVEVDILI